MSSRKIVIIIFIFISAVLIVWLNQAKPKEAFQKKELSLTTTPIPTINKNFYKDTPTPHPSITISPTSSEPSPTPKLEGFCNYVPILLYHHIQPLDIAKKENHAWMTVSPEKFAEQMDYLSKKGYRTITADELSQALFSKQKLPAKTIMITMDDGYADIYTYAFPIIKKYNITINVGVITGFLENKDYFSWSQLKEMTDSGLVIPLNHTWSHVNLKKATNEKIEFEISTAQKQIEEKLGKTVKSFVYPYGSIDQRAVEFLQKTGYTSAFSTILGSWQCDSFILSLHRMRVGNLSLSAYGL